MENQALIAKLKQGRPVALAPDEVQALREALREAIAIVLDRPVHQVQDDARLFDDLALDSIDVFDVLDQLAERFDAQVALEELPTNLLRGEPEMTFTDFAQGILTYFASPPPAAPAPKAPPASG